MHRRRFRVTAVKQPRSDGADVETFEVTAADEAGARSVATASGYDVIAVVELGVLRSDEPDATLNSLREEIRGVRKDLREVEGRATRHAFFGALLALIVFTVVSWFIAALLNR
jgi:acid phosphatase family membrane protein YuiD